MPDGNKIKVLGVIKGRNYLVVQRTLTVFERRHPNPEACTIEVVGKEDAPTVVFTMDDPPAGIPKRFGLRPGSEFNVSDRDLAALDGPNPEVQDTIRSSSLPFVGAALAVFPRAGDLADYKIQVVGEGEAVVVIFTAADQPAGTRGGGGSKPAYEVEMAAADRRVLRSNFVR